MANFKQLVIRERSDGTPGFMDQDFLVIVNLDEVSLITPSETEEGICFIRLVCGATLCVTMPVHELAKLVGLQIPNESPKIAKIKNKKGKK